VKQRLDSPLRGLRGPGLRGLRRIHKRYLGRHCKRPLSTFKNTLVYEMYVMAVDFWEYMNVLIWHPRRSGHPKRSRRRGK